MEKSQNLALWLPEDTDPLEVSKLTENFEVLDSAASGGIKVKCIAIKSSTTWTVPSTALNNKFQVLCQGGGEKGGDGVHILPITGGAGGKSGKTTVADLELSPGAAIQVTIGSGNSGLTSFGSYFSAQGGAGGATDKKVDFSSSSLDYIQRALNIVESTGGETGNGGGRAGEAGGGADHSGNAQSGFGGGGGFSIGDGTRGHNGRGSGYWSNVLVATCSLGGFGGYGYGAGGGGGGSSRQVSSAGGQIIDGVGGMGAPGIVLVAWEEV